MLELGQVVVTCGVNDHVADDIEFAKFVTNSIRRHKSKDWGDCCAEDTQTNNDAAEHGGRILSAYKDPVHPKIWIITEHDRSVTTVLFPEEY